MDKKQLIQANLEFLKRVELKGVEAMALVLVMQDLETQLKSLENPAKEE